jgi:hypothetical protein
MLKVAFYAIALILIISCKEKDEKKTSDPKENVEALKINQSANIEAFFPLLNQSALSTNEVATYRKSAFDIVHHRNKEQGNKVYTILEKDKWKFEAVFKGSSFTRHDSIGVKWIDFKDDFTYDYGMDKELKGKGIYTYNFDTGLLLLVDDDISIKPHEYNVKIHNDVIILEGKQTYKDNNLQAKLGRLTTPVN